MLSFFLYFPNTEKVFLSIASKNIKSDILNSSSFDLGISEIDTNRLSIIDCLPNILRWELIEKPIDYVNKYNYSVSLTENNEIFYKGQFNY